MYVSITEVLIFPSWNPVDCLTHHKGFMHPTLETAGLKERIYILGEKQY